MNTIQVQLPRRASTVQRSRNSGFSLVEALVTLLIVSLGMLAIVGLQIGIGKSADLGKQRAEATRLAQQKLEQLRAFGSLTLYASSMVNNNDTIATSANYATNTSFARSWKVSAAGTPDSGRTAQVTVNWTDSAGETQNVQLVSSIAASDPVLEGSLWFPLPDGTILRRPKNRSIDIPIPATSVTGTGKSYVPRPGSTNQFLVFSDASGDVVQSCSETPNSSNLSDASICRTFDGYILSGYLSGPRASAVTGIALGNRNYISGEPACSVGQAYDQNSPTVALSGFYYYVCLITPTDHDTNVATAKVWTARADLTGPGVGTFTCRYTPSASTTNNNLHPATYSLVDRSLDNQNYFVTNNVLDCDGAGLALHKTNTNI